MIPQPSNQNDDFPVSPQVVDALATICARILRVGYFEATRQTPIKDIFDYCVDLRQMLANYNFASKEELEVIPTLEIGEENMRITYADMFTAIKPIVFDLTVHKWDQAFDICQAFEKLALEKGANSTHIQVGLSFEKPLVQTLSFGLKYDEFDGSIETKFLQIPTSIKLHRGPL